MRQRVMSTAAAAVLLVSLAGCAGAGGAPKPQTDESVVPSAPAAEPADVPAEPSLGVPFEVRQNDGTASITIQSATWGPTLAGDFVPDASSGGFLVLDVLWETSEGVSSSNPLYFKAKDADGYEGGFALFGIDPALGSGDVPMGDKVRGNVGFDISGNGPYTIVVTNQLLQEAARLTVDATPRS